MNAIVQLIKWLFSLLFAGLRAGINAIRKVAPKVVDPYLDALEWFTYIAIGVPVAFMIAGFLLYWLSLLGQYEWFSWLAYLKPTWRIVVLLGGISALVLWGLFGILLSPPGVLASAAMMSPQHTAPRQPLENLPWYGWFSPVGLLRELRDMSAGFMETLREAIKRYVKIVRTVVVITAFGFFFFAILPRPEVTLLLLAIVGVSAIWMNQEYRTVWSWLVQGVAVAAMSAYYLYVFITGHTFISRWFPKVEPDVVMFNKQAGEVTSSDVRTFFGEHWIGVTIGVAAVMLLAYLAVKLFKKAAAPAGATGGSGHQTATAPASTHGSGGGSWLGKAVMIGCLALCVGMAAIMVMKAMELHERRKAYIEESMRDARLSAEAQRTMSLLAQVNGRAAAQAVAPKSAPAPASAPTELWYGLLKPEKYSIILSTNLSERIPRPAGFSVRLAPGGLNEELWVNGKRISRVPGTLTAIPPETTYIQVRWTTPTPTNVVVGVGEEVK